MHNPSLGCCVFYDGNKTTHGVPTVVVMERGWKKVYTAQSITLPTASVNISPSQTVLYIIKTVVSQFYLGRSMETAKISS
jgi:hypothetical protein